MAIPLLDHVITNLKERFDDKNQIISKINNLLSLNIIGLDKQDSIRSRRSDLYRTNSMVQITIVNNDKQRKHKERKQNKHK